MFTKLALCAVVLLTIANAQLDPSLCGEGCITCPVANQCLACDANYTLLEGAFACTLNNATTGNNGIIGGDNSTNATNGTNGTDANGTVIGGDNSTNATNGTNGTGIIGGDNSTNATNGTNGTGIIGGDNSTNATNGTNGTGIIGGDNSTNATNGTNTTYLGNPNCSVAFCEVCDDNVTTCNQCIAAYWFDPTTLNGTCQSCGAGCLNCSSNFTCSLCDSTFTLVAGACQSNAAQGSQQPTTTAPPAGGVVPVGTTPTTSNPPNAACTTQFCSSCSADGLTCSICQDGYYLAGAQCLQCQSNCLTCSDANTCTACSSGYYLGLPSGSNSGSSVSANAQSACTVCPSGCTQCSSSTSCSACASGYRLLNLPSSTTCASAFGGKLTLSIAAVFLALISIFIH